MPSISASYAGDDITVLMATYNNPDIIKETVASLRSQSVQAGLIVVLDDGSNLPEALQTLDWLETLPNFKVVRSLSNEGLCACRVKLLEHANTPLSIFVDSDDLLAPDYFKKTLAALNESPEKPDAVLTWRRNFGSSNELVVMNLLGDHYHLLRNDFRMTALIHTEVLKRIGFDSSMRNGEADDWLFWLNFNRLGYKAVMVGEALFHYRFAEGSMSWPWSEGQATLTGIDIAKFLAAHRSELSDQAFEDLYAERIWHQLNTSSDQQQGYDQFAGETFNALFRWAVRLRQTRPKLFWLGQKTTRAVARVISPSK
jgi:glycosyltransferase involved in cell wall biosynthesis